MYKDKDKQRQAQKEAMRRRRAKGITKGITKQGITKPDDVIPLSKKQEGLLIAIFGEQLTLEHQPWVASDPECQAIWDRHRAQGRPTVYPCPATNGVWTA